MLIIDRRILIVHMRKCGGTSFCLGLINILPAERLFYLGYTAEGEALSAAYRKGPGRVWKHATTRRILRGLGLAREDLEIHLLAMRPWWERVASYYFHARRYNAANPAKHRWVAGMSFSDYLRSAHLNRDRLDDYACDDAGQRIVDHIVRFRDIGRAYHDLCLRLGHPGQVIPHENRNLLKAEVVGDQDTRALYSPADWAWTAAQFQGETDFMQAEGLEY